MTTGQQTCDLTLLDRFVDQEVGPEEQAQISEHLGQCPSCQKALQDLRAISTLFKTSMERGILYGRLEDLEEQVMTRIHGTRVSWWLRLKELLFSKKLYIPAAAAAAVALFVYLTMPSAPVRGPSAIINSFTGEITSVMIIETPRSRQTILWFHETSAAGEEENGMEEA
ncbi:MAG: zf-HC2 domain-containing protein [Deltaproteobacteria bacterium]|nr:zf-HC2 domain-containing protein [Deltaproteobacteria bacterium]